jgi:hypothetical protein
VSANEELVELGDADELVRHVGRLARAEAWRELEDLRGRCRRSHERGRQLWGVAALAEYRLALDAPAELAAAVVVEGAGRGTWGPLSEVVAMNHRWDELADHLPAGPLRSIVAHERALRGDEPEPDGLGGDDPWEIPLALATWEPAYPLARYEADDAAFPTPPTPTGPAQAPAALRATARDPIEQSDADRSGVDALLGLVGPWVEDSTGRAAASVVEGSAIEALRSLRVPEDRLTLQVMEPEEVLAWMGWAAASGGAHGRRRGAAAGRFEAWWTLAALAGLDDPWPPHEDELGDAARELRWWWWDAGEPHHGWQLRLAVEDPADGLAWALHALDAS